MDTLPTRKRGRHIDPRMDDFYHKNAKAMRFARRRMPAGYSMLSLFSKLCLAPSDLVQPTFPRRCAIKEPMPGITKRRSRLSTRSNIPVTEPHHTPSLSAHPTTPTSSSPGSERRCSCPRRIHSVPAQPRAVQMARL